MATDSTMIDLPKFLKNHKREKNGEITHTVIADKKMGIYGGSYYIPDSDMDEFLKIYYTHVFKCGKDAYMTERHRENIGPIVIDLDFRFEGNTSRKYDENFLANFLHIYNTELYSLLDVPKAKCVAFVMEKPDCKYVEDKNQTKDGIHIMYPYIVVEPKVQFALRYKTIMNPECIKLFKNLGVSNSVDDIFDKCVIETNPWLLYGSKKPGNVPYLLTKRYDYNLTEVKTPIKRKDLIRTLSVRNFDKKYTHNVTEEEKGKIEELIKKIPEKQKPKRTMNRLKKLKSPANKIFASDEDFNTAKRLVSILKVERADNYELWIRLGFCLHNIDYRLLETWDEFSKKSSKYTSGVCRTEWVNMNSEGLNMGSLCRWAKEDNIIKYNEIMNENKKKIMLDALSATHSDVAKVVYHFFKHEFVCTSLKNSTWFQFKNHRWRKNDDAISLKKYISDFVVDAFIELQSEINTEAVNTDSSNSWKEILIEKSNKISKLITQLKKQSFKKALVSECGELFYIEKFEEELDKKLNLIGFENGVYDLDENEFREGYPEDNISYTTGIYYQDYEDDEEEIMAVKLFMEQVLPIKSVRDYMYTLLSSFLHGRVKEQKFHIWTGCGGNGKSKLIELFRMAFGEYCCTLPVSLITQKRNRAESASPALAQTNGKRFACFQEPEGDESINVGLMKELSGSDTIMARGLHQAPIQFKPQFKMVLTCNVLPEINASDRGTWRRVRKVEFKSVFTDKPDPDDPFQFEIDEELDDKLDSWKEPFMFLLIREYQNYAKNGIIEPEEVLKATKEYQNDSDNFTQFFEECIVQDDAYNGDFLSISDMYEVYKDWFVKQKGSNVTIPRQKDLKSNAINKYGVIKGNKWNGIKLKADVFNDEEYVDC